MHRIVSLLFAALLWQCTGGPSPENDTCDGPADCDPGFTCQAGQCVELCISDRDCEKNEACNDGTCLEVSDPGCMADVQCFEPAQCENIAGAECWGGACLYGDIADGTACNASGGSNLDGLCLAGTCVARGDFQCSTNDACGDGTCIGGACAELSGLHGPCDDPPADSDDCGTDLACVTGACLMSDGGGCVDNGDCANTCVGPTCEALGGDTDPCDTNDDADCGPGFVCEGTACAPGTLCPGGNGDCTPTAESCIDGVCKDRGNTCDSSDDADCLGGQQCVSTTCLWNDGEDCSQNSQCVNACIATLCADYAATGEACDDSDNADCDSAFLHTCTQVDSDWECRRRDDQPCTSDDECSSDYCPVDVCQPSPICVDESTCGGLTPRCRYALTGSTVKTCNAAGLFDEPCDDDPDCGANLKCDTSLSVPVCKYDAGQACTTDNDCFDNCICGDNECQVNNRICSTTTCATCRYSNDNGASCNSLLAAGTSCDSDANIATVEFCSSGGACLDDVGGSCTDDSDCYLGHCECTDDDCSETKTCAASDCGACSFTSNNGTSCDGDIVAGTDCAANKKCDGSGGCWWDTLNPCSVTELCWSGFCRIDVDDNGQYCAATAGQCIYDGGINNNDGVDVSTYENNQWAPSAECVNPRRPHCESGVWNMRCSTICSAGCTYGNTLMEEYCHPSLEREIWQRVTDCNASTCDWNSTPTTDELQETCEATPDDMVCVDDFIGPGIAFCEVRGCQCWSGIVEMDACGMAMPNCTSPNECECELF